MVLINGGEGVAGCAGITTLADNAETQVAKLVTVKLYVPVASPEIVVLVPVPVRVNPPVYLVRVHSPVEGSPNSSTEPVATEHVGGVIVPIEGAGGVAG